MSEEKPLNERFLALLASKAPDGRQKEQWVQDFLEENSELLPTTTLLNHGLQFQAVVSKYALASEHVCDYAFVTKSSDRWRVTFVELESPDKKIFTMDEQNPHFTKAFNDAKAQVQRWRTFVKRNEAEALRHLEPLFKPDNMRRMPFEFRYQLIIGRSDNKNLSPERMGFIVQEEEDTGIQILSYDSLIRYWENGPRRKKNVLAVAGNRLKFKLIHTSPGHMFSYVGPDQLALSATDKTYFRNLGYEIDTWTTGELLTVGMGKYGASTSFEDEMEKRRLPKGN
ncbi:DUF4263 domain-containing protein [Bacillus sp. NP157]|nr:DUF4263 domain-containing protein [Bacillus sp. NP157]